MCINIGVKFDHISQILIQTLITPLTTPLISIPTTQNPHGIPISKSSSRTNKRSRHVLVPIGGCSGGHRSDDSLDSFPGYYRDYG